MGLSCGSVVRSLLLLTAAFLATAPGRPDLNAQEPRQPIREVEVPASQPQLWPPGKWTPIPQESYREFLSTYSRPADSVEAPQPLLQTLTFTGTLNSDSLVGAFEGTLPELPSVPTQLDLTGAGIALADLRWGERPATWGVAPDQRLVVLTRPDETRLAGQWGLRGRAVFDSFEFDFQSPPALACVVKIALPAAWRMDADVPTSAEISANADTRVWTADLGHRRKARFTIRRSSVSTDMSRQLACEEVTVASVTRTGLESVTDLTLIGEPSSQDMGLSVPRDLQVGSILLGEVALAFKREAGETSDRIIVRLPDLQSIGRQTLRIRAAQPVRWNAKSVTVRTLAIPGAVILRRVLTLQVDRPMELQRLEPTSFLQTDVAADGVRETYSFEAVRTDASLKVAAAEPEVRVATECQVLADLRTENPVVWNLVSLQSVAGEAYRFDIPVPDSWEVVRVQPRGETPDSTLSQWNFERKNPQSGIVSIEFRRGLTPQTPKNVLIELRGQPLGSGPSSVIPVLAPPTSRSVNASIIAWLPDDADPRIAAASPWQKRPAAEIPVSLIQAGRQLSPDLNFEAAQSFAANVKRVPPEFRVGRRQAGGAEVPMVPTAPGALPEPVTPGPPSSSSSQLHVTTSMGPAAASEHIHLAKYRFHGEPTLSSLQFELPEGLRPVSIQDDRGELAFAVTEGRLVFGESNRRVSMLDFEYRTPASPGWFSADEKILFPQLRGFDGPLLWRIELSGQRAFLGCDLPWSNQSVEKFAPAWTQMLGPLARRGDESVFNPMQRRDWRALILPESTLSRDQPEIVHLCPTIPAEVHLRTYSRPRARTLAWTLFLGCLGAGAIARKYRWTLVRQVGFYSMAIFLPLAWLLPPQYGIQMGAIASGLTLIYLVPRSLVAPLRKPAETVTGRRDSSTGAKIAVATALLISTIVATALAQGEAVVPEGAASSDLVVLVPTEDGHRQESVYLDPAAAELFARWKRDSSLPAYLFESARYSLSGAVGRLTGRAEIGVTILEPSSPLTIRLPIDQISLDATGFQVDGERVRVLPSADGKSILAPLEFPVGEAAAPDGRPLKKTLRFDFLPRQDGADFERMQMTLPAAGDTQFQFTSPDPAALPTIERSLGPVAAPSAQAWQAALGARGTIAVVWPNRSTTTSSRELSAQSLVEVEPLSVRIQSRIDFPLDARPERSIHLPATAVFDSVTGTTISNWRLSRDGATGEQRLDVRFRESTASTRASIVLSYRLPIALVEGALTLPPLVRIANNELLPHRIGIAFRPGAPRFTLARDDKGARTIATLEFTQSLPDEIVWPTPDLCVEQSQPLPLILAQLPPVTPRSLRIRQGLVVDRTQMKWTGIVELEPRTAVQLAHVLKIDPRVTVSSVSVEQDGAERLVRFLRQDDELLLFVRSRTADRLTVRLEGILAGDSLQWSALPLIGVQEGEIASSSISIKNESGWQLETDAETAGPPEPPATTRPVSLSFDMLSQSGQKFRLRPGPDAADARLWVRVSPLADGQADVVWHYSFNAVDGPLHVLSGVVPPEIASHQPSSSAPLTTTPETGETRFTIAPSTQAPQQSQITLRATLPPGPSGVLTIPELQLDSAQVVQRRLLLPRDSSMIPAAGTATTAPAPKLSDLPAEWRTGLILSDLEVYSGRAAGMVLERRNEAAMTGQAKTSLVESVIWTSSTLPTQGLTRLIVLAEQPSALTVRIPEGLTVLRSSINDQRDEAPTISGGALILRVDPGDSPASVELFWEQAALSGGEAIPVPSPADSRSTLTAVVPRRDIVETFPAGSEQTPFDATLNHFQALLETVREQRTRSWAIDDPILLALRQTSQVLEREAKRPDLLASPSRQQFEQLMVQWKEIQATLPVNASTPATPASPQRHLSEPDLMTELLTSGSDAAAVRFFDVPTAVPAPSLSVSRPWLVSGLAVAAGLVLLVILRKADRVQRRLETAEWVADRAFVAIVTLGTLWWLALSPSALGMLIIASAIATKAFRRIRRQTAPLAGARSTASFQIR
jgi:hypothetical protein